MSDLLEQARRLASTVDSDFDPDWMLEQGYDQISTTLRALVARVEAAERDAERYRFIRDGDDSVRYDAEWWLCGLGPQELDAAIDEARKQA